MTREYPEPGFPLRLPPYRVSAGTGAAFVLTPHSFDGSPLSYADLAHAAIAITPGYFGVLFGDAKNPNYYGDTVVSMPEPVPKAGIDIRPPPRACLIEGANAQLLAAIKAQVGKRLEAANVWAFSTSMVLPGTGTTTVTDSYSVPYIPPTGSNASGGGTEVVTVVDPSKWTGRELLYIRLFAEASASAQLGLGGVQSYANGTGSFGSEFQFASAQISTVNYYLAPNPNFNAATDAAQKAAFGSGIFKRCQVVLGMMFPADLYQPPDPSAYTPAGLASLNVYLQALRDAETAGFRRMASAAGGTASLITVADGGVTDGSVYVAAAPTIVGWIETFFGV